MKEVGVDESIMMVKVIVCNIDYGDGGGVDSGSCGVGNSQW